MFIVFEGPEGSGKSCNAAWLAQWLRERGRQVVQVREPGGTPLGEAIRAILLDGAITPSPRAGLLLFEAARAELLATLVGPALRGGASVVCDRFAASSLAYQGYGEGQPLDQVAQANALATDGLQPDLIILLDLDPEVGLRRRASSAEWNALDARSLEFHRRVRGGFLDLAANDPDRWLVLDATLPLDIIRTAIAARLHSAQSAWQGQ